MAVAVRSFVAYPITTPPAAPSVRLRVTESFTDPAASATIAVAAAIWNVPPTSQL